MIKVRQTFLLALHSRSGGVLVMVGLMLPVLFGFAALAVDVAFWHHTKRDMQTAADAAAIAAAFELADAGATTQDVIDAARADAAVNGFTHGAGSQVDVTIAPGNVSVAVTITQPASVFLSAALTTSPGNVASRAAAAPGGGSPVCLLALDPASQKSFELSGGSQFTGNGCEVHVNSSHDKAISVSGGGSITSQATCVTGGVEASGGSTLTPAANTNCPPMTDPLAGLAPPADQSCLETDLVISGGTETLSPGKYCGGIEMTGGADVTFLPGLYIIEGELKNGGGGSITGDGVSFYLVGPDARVEISGGGTLTLKAMTTGPLAGILFFQDPASNAFDDSKLSGGSDMTYEGTLYFPTQELEMSGGSTGTTASPYTMIVAWQVLVSGGGELVFNSDFAASSVPVPPGLAGGQTALIE